MVRESNHPVLQPQRLLVTEIKPINLFVECPLDTVVLFGIP